MRRYGSLLLAVAWLCVLAGCVNVKAPERIVIGGSDRPPPVDSGRVPQPATLEEAQQELVKAYQNIQYLERENARLDDRADKYKSERDQYKKRLKKYEKD